MLNPPDLIRWNARKTYLKDLKTAGVSVVPTLWRERSEPADMIEALDRFDADRIVVKPQTGAGAVGLFTVRRRDGAALGGHPTLATPHMIQPFLPSVTTEGEHSYVFFNGHFAHGLIKKPADGDFRSQGEYGARETLIAAPAPADIAAATRALAAAPGGAPPLYARVDLVRGDEGRLLLMELELIEPQLYFNVAPEGAAALIHAIGRRLGRSHPTTTQP